MPTTARTALVLQGGGALGAYEWGAARRLYERPGFAPEVISGVSIGAITAVLLARPAEGLTPIAALERFWRAVTVPGWIGAAPWRGMASIFGNPGFFTPRADLACMASWTSLYDTRPLRRTLAGLVDQAALADPAAGPRLIVSATDVAAGQIRYFDSAKGGLGLDHILASGSLPPAFPMTEIDGRAYWDGGLFDNTPLGPVLDAMSADPDEDRRIYVVDLFPNRAPLPRTLAEVAERMSNLSFVNRTAEDLKLLRRFDEVARLMAAIEALPESHPIKTDPAFQRLKARRYSRAPQVIAITRPEEAGTYDGLDFSPETIAARADEGYAQAHAALARAEATAQTA